MRPPTPSAFHPELITPWLLMIGFGAFHGLNPGMGWLFALSLGLQRRSEKAVWIALVPIAAGHAASIAVIVLVLAAGFRFVPVSKLQLATALLLIVFGIYKLFRYYRHPYWVGMKVGLFDLAWWSFLMATAHGAGLMVAPALISIANAQNSGHMHNTLTGESGMVVGLLVHTMAMLIVMAVVAWLVYKYFGLAVLRRKWVNFDLLWAGALILVGGIALVAGFLSTA